MVKLADHLTNQSTTHLSTGQKVDRQKLTVAVGQREVEDLLLVVRVVKMAHGASALVAVALGDEAVAGEVDLVAFEGHERCEVATRVAERDGILEAEARLPGQGQIDAC